ncbi:MAG: crossover junction endodeoxyribonuclease RuvC [Candidatus Obscuribacterales bacterium]|nr:crossover junction endodeoxyribonuclease RuvC [Candidatus Obscuribacterales bacterium]
MNQDLRILGIDPGTATTGYGIIDLQGQDCYSYVASGTVKTSKDLCQSQRLQIIRADILWLIKEYNPDVLAIESIFFFKNAKTLVPVAQARGVIIEAAGSQQIPVVEYTPMQVKMTVAGYGKAEKSEVQFIVARLMNHKEIIKPDDASDAVAIAICHARCRHAMTGQKQTTA